MPQNKKISRTYIAQGIIIALFALILLLILANERQRIRRLDADTKKMQELASELEYDRLRLEDVTNILLALQDYQYDHRGFPNTLQELREKGYLDPQTRLADPSTHVPYYYRPEGSEFVFCINLTDMVKGVNPARCPHPDDVASAANPPVSATSTLPVVPTKQELTILGDAPVYVREQPQVGSKIITRVKPGGTYMFTGEDGGWYYIIVSPEMSGWLNGEYARPLPKE